MSRLIRRGLTGRVVHSPNHDRIQPAASSSHPARSNFDKSQSRPDRLARMLHVACRNRLSCTLWDFENSPRTITPGPCTRRRVDRAQSPSVKLREVKGRRTCCMGFVPGCLRTARTKRPGRPQDPMSTRRQNMRSSEQNERSIKCKRMSKAKKTTVRTNPRIHLPRIIEGLDEILRLEK
jgi:hypothetical protein